MEADVALVQTWNVSTLIRENAQGRHSLLSTRDSIEHELRGHRIDSLLALNPILPTIEV